MNASLAGAPAAPGGPAADHVQAPALRCLVVNRRSFRVAQGTLVDRAIALARAHGAEILEAGTLPELVGGFDRLLARGLREAYVFAGDGTVQVIVDRLAALPEGSKIPLLLILPGGRTNLTAADVGARGRPLQRLEAALKQSHGSAPVAVEERDVLVIEQPPLPPRRGFFLAGGMVHGIVRETHRHRRGRSDALGHGPISTQWNLLKLIFAWLIGRSPLLPHPSIRVEAAGLGRLDGPTRVLIASTLQHREGLFDPYADRGQGRLRYTGVTASAPGFWTRLPWILTGRFKDWMTPDNGYLSGRCERLEITGLSHFMLDGEMFEVDPSRPVTIGAGPRLAFLSMRSRSRCARPPFSWFLRTGSPLRGDPRGLEP